MNPLDYDLVRQYVDEKIGDFHRHRVAVLQQLDLETVLTKNFYLLKATNMIGNTGRMIENCLDTYMSQLEEQLFGEFLKGLAIFIANNTYNCRQSFVTGVDLEFLNGQTLFLLCIRPGANWEDSLQWVSLEQELQKAQILYEESFPSLNVQPVLGICYGKTPATYAHKASYLIVTGQEFWHFISENKNLYTDLIELIGYRASEHNSLFSDEQCRVINRLQREFTQTFQKANGEMDLVKLVEFHCGNFDSMPLSRLSN
jgi:hypothetical protein